MGNSAKSLSMPSLQIDWEQNANYKGREAFDFPWPKTSPFRAELEPTNCPAELTVNFWFKRNNVEDHPNAANYFKPRAGLSKFQVIAEGDDSKKSFKRLHRGRYSPTVCYGNNEVHLHPCLPRRISVCPPI